MEVLAERNGVTLNLGEVKRVDQYIADVNESGDSAEPIVVASRVVAHIAHRLPFVKTFTKRFEGQDKNSGIFSDIMTLGAQVASLNEDLITDRAGAMLGKYMTQKKGGQEVKYFDFGPSDPIFIPDDQQNNTEVI